MASGRPVWATEGDLVTKPTTKPNNNNNKNNSSNKHTH